MVFKRYKSEFYRCFVVKKSNVGPPSSCQYRVIENFLTQCIK